MDPMVEGLMQYGWAGLVMASAILVARALGPSVQSLIPAMTSAKGKREALLMDALTQATRVMAETVSVLQSLRVEVSAARDDQSELRLDVENIARELELPRPRVRKARKGVAVPEGAA